MLILFRECTKDEVYWKAMYNDRRNGRRSGQSNVRTPKDQTRRDATKRTTLQESQEVETITFTPSRSLSCRPSSSLTSGHCPLHARLVLAHAQVQRWRLLDPSRRVPSALQARGSSLPRRPRPCSSASGHLCPSPSQCAFAWAQIDEEAV